MKSERPDFIKHYSEIQESEEDAHYPGSTEILSIGAPFGKTFGLTRLGIHHEVLPPGRRLSWPHAHSADEEFVYVISGTPDAWIDGHLHRLQPGDGIGFTPNTGITHTFINNTENEVQLLVIGDTRRPDDKGIYPLNPEGNAILKSRNRFWENAPKRELGPHNGKPNHNPK